MTTAVTTIEPKQEIAPVENNSAFASITAFVSAQRMAQALAASKTVPETYRGNVPDCLIALEYAHRIGASVLAVMQNLYIVHGKPAWSSQFLISCVNASKRFSPLRYKATGTKGQDDYGCICWATDRTGEVLESPEITIGMAKAEGWFQKNGSKWKTMPDLMLRYRAATLFARLYAPELTMGMKTEEEFIDIESAQVVHTSPVVTEPTFKKALPEPAFESAPAVKTIADEIGDMLTAQDVSFDSFKAWLESTALPGNFNVDPDTIADFGSIPERLAKAIAADSKGLKMCVDKFGKK